jgi:hypothetical protein
MNMHHPAPWRGMAPSIFVPLIYRKLTAFEYHLFILSNFPPKLSTLTMTEGPLLDHGRDSARPLTVFVHPRPQLAVISEYVLQLSDTTERTVIDHR